jgi:hypothetical protein
LFLKEKKKDFTFQFQRSIVQIILRNWSEALFSVRSIVHVLDRNGRSKKGGRAGPRLSNVGHYRA